MRFRELVKERVTNPPKRRIFWENALDGVVAEKVLAGDEESAEALLRKMLDGEDNILRGEVYLVGAGPGDPDLLTFRALRLMQKADVVVYDNLVSKTIVDMTRRDAQRIFVGKKRARSHHAPGRNQRTAGAPGQGRQARAAPQGRRPLHLRTRRRGNRDAGGGKAFPSRWYPASPQPPASLPTPASR